MANKVPFLKLFSGSGRPEPLVLSQVVLLGGEGGGYSTKGPGHQGPGLLPLFRPLRSCARRWRRFGQGLQM